MSSYRTGIGYDVHRTDPSRTLMLGGIEIEDAPFGLAGHSDADVVLHAVTDACLGAAALGDIGQHFPDTDPIWENADSGLLLERIVTMLSAGGWSVANVDVTVIAEAPKLVSHIPRMRQRLAELLNCPVDAASVKATTHEGLGPLGHAEGIAAQAVVTITSGIEGDGH
jgi:2-C-methyl-D-erythritol 2,4-cyclodiphosphate synthase